MNKVFRTALLLYLAVFIAMVSLVVLDVMHGRTTLAQMAITDPTYNTVKDGIVNSIMTPLIIAVVQLIVGCFAGLIFGIVKICNRVTSS